MILLLWLPMTLAAPGAFPLVDPGLFVISGVQTCGGGGGYCLLGLDCTLDEDFLPDLGEGQHCEGLRSAFTPSAHFVCCRAAKRPGHKPPAPAPGTAPGPANIASLDVLENEIENVVHKVAESVGAVHKAPSADPTEAPGEAPEMRESEEESDDSDESSVLDEDVLEDALEGGIVPGAVDKEDDYEEEMQNDQGVVDSGLEKETTHEYENAERTTNSDIVLQEPKLEESSEEKLSEENTISSETTENESSIEENDSEEYETTTNIAAITEESVTPYITKSDKVEEYLQEDISKEVSSKENEIYSDRTEIPLTILEENVTENLLPKESPTENNKIETTFPPDEDNLKEISGQPNKPDTQDIVKKGIQKPNFYTNQNISENESKIDAERTKPKTDKTKAKPISLKVSNTKKQNPPQSSPDTKLNEVVISVQNNKNSENSLHHVIGGQNKHVNDKMKTNTTDKPSTETTTVAKSESVTTSAVHPGLNSGQGQPGVGATQGASCSRSASKNCTEEVKFVFQKRTLCFGSIYALDWIVTSASCALRVFRAGMVNVTIVPLGGESGRGQVRTIVVHESYVESTAASGQQMEANNIGLVQLKAAVSEWAPCVPCLPQPGRPLSRNCSAVTSRPVASAQDNCSPSGSCKQSRAEAATPRCEGAARDMQDDLGFHYLTLPCDTLWEPRFSGPTRGTGSPLFCEDVLAGLESSSGVGMMVYTPLERYLDWLRTNTRPGPPEQHFNVG